VSCHESYILLWRRSEASLRCVSHCIWLDRALVCLVMILIWCNFVLMCVWYGYLCHAVDLVWRLLLCGLWRRVLWYIRPMISEVLVHCACTFNAEECSITVTTVLVVSKILNGTGNNWDRVSYSAIKMEVAHSYATLVPIHFSTRCHIPEDGNLHCHRHENFRSLMDQLRYCYYDPVLDLTWVWLFISKHSSFWCNVRYTQFNIKYAYLAFAFYLCVLSVSQDKEKMFP